MSGSGYRPGKGYGSRPYAMKMAVARSQFRNKPVRRAIAKLARITWKAGKR